jgi:hypothetical protein
MSSGQQEHAPPAASAAVAVRSANEPRLTLDQLRHTSPMAPGERTTRTLRQQQQQSRPLTPDDLRSRRRTPPRPRESPLRDALRRHRIDEDDDPSVTTNSTTLLTSASQATTPGRISIRPLAGLAIGTRLSTSQRVCLVVYHSWAPRLHESQRRSANCFLAFSCHPH